MAKASSGKASVGGEKFALRRRNDAGVATQEIVGISHEPTDDGDDRELLVDYVTGGELRDGYVGAQAVERARERHAQSMAELPRAARRLSEGEPVIPTVIEPGTAH